MKWFYLSFVLFFVSAMGNNKTSWTQVPTEEQEIRIIQQNISTLRMRIAERFCGHGGSTPQGNGAYQGALSEAIFCYLKQLNSPVSFKVLKQLIDNGTLPKFYLNNV